MSDAEYDPHVLVSARASEHPKLIELPNDRARWGWVVMLGKAKLQRPPGRFASLRVLDSILGEYRRFIDDYVKVGVLEPIGHLCDECSKVIPQVDRRPGEIVVHDWAKNQSRTQRWRREKGLTSGHENLTGNQSGNDGETLGETTGKRPHAGARVSQSQSIEVVRPTTTESRGRGVGEGLPNLDSAVAKLWEQATGRSVLSSGNYAAEYLDDVCRRHPKAEVGAAIIRARKEFDHIPDGPSMVSSMRRILDPFVDPKVAAAKEREREQRAASSRAVEATLRRNHETGFHEKAREPRCPLCSEDAA